MKFTLKYKIRRYKRVKSLEDRFKNLKLFTSLNTNQKINFAEFEIPKVSIIIPFYNQIDYTLNCLNHLHKQLDNSIPFEIILIDDNSPQEYDFSEIKGIQLIRNNENLGFLKNCNNGILASKGEYIYFLNNDTEVQKGFLKELLFVFENFPNVGAVGSMLLNTNGSLQEAGSVFMKDFTIHQIVRKRKPYFPDVNYIKKVDYCSGCSLLFKKHKDNGDLNLLDEKFIPAYFEETDFCFDLKYNQGKEIYYTPFSKVLHFNGVSYNQKEEKPDEDKQKKKDALFEKNATLFKSKWRHILDNIHSKTVEARILEKHDNKSIIFYNSSVPEYDKDSGANRLKEIMVAFKNLGYQVTFLCNQNYINNPYNEFYQRLGIQVFYEFDKFNDYEKFLKKNFPIDTIHWFYGPNTFIQYIDSIKKLQPNSKTIYDMVDIHHIRLDRAIELGESIKSNARRYKKYYKIETQDIKKADKIIAISDFEFIYMQKFFDKEKLVTVSNIHYPKIKIEDTLPFEDRKDILFIGSQHIPNVDALYFLFNQIMPLVWKELPELKVNIIGNINEIVKDINHPNFVFQGFVHDITDFFISNKMNIAPLRYGAGVKGKIGQSFEYYLPVVTTSIGAEGMKLVNNENALIDDSPEGFASNIIKLYTDKNLWLHLQKNSENSLIPFSRENLEKIINDTF